MQQSIVKLQLPMVDASSNLSNPTGVVAILDLPVGSYLTIDGFSLVLKRNDFVGFSEIGPGFHLIAIKPAAATKKDGNSQMPTLTHGLVVTPSSWESWSLVRKYDPQLEEVSATPVDELTATNLLEQVRQGRMVEQQQRILSYPQLINENSVNGTQPSEKWKEDTCFVSQSLLQKRRLGHGIKIVPGAYDEPQGQDNTNSTIQKADGISIQYPPIPCIDQAVSLHEGRHGGTKRYLAQLPPSDRSALFLSSSGSGSAPGEQVLTSVISKYYNESWQDLLGDLQLAFLMFLNLQCFASFQHWRDLIAMLSLVPKSSIPRRAALYTHLLETLQKQLADTETDFFVDTEAFSSGNDDNFLVPAIHRLVSLCESSDNGPLEQVATSFRQFVWKRFPAVFDNDNDMGEPDQRNNSFSDLMMLDDSDNDSEDGPVVVSSDEIIASMARQSGVEPQQEPYPAEHRQEYPLLFASMQHHEDILMTCARILDEKVDVSLVREAAAYLEQVEAKK